MPAPYDYTMQMQSPIQALQQGFGFGAAALQAQQARAQMEQQRAQQQAEAARQAALDEVLPGYLQDIESGKMPSLKSIIEIESLMPEAHREMIAQYRQNSDATRRKTLASTGLKVVMGLQQGDGSFGVDLLQEQLEAAKNSGDVQSARDLEGLLKVAKINPKAAAGQFLPQVYQIDPDFVGGSIATMEKARALTDAQAGGFEVKSSEDLPGGYTKQIGRFGEVRLVGPDGRMVAPDQASSAIDQIYALDARRAGSKAASVRAAELDQEITRGGTAAGAKEAGQQAMKAGVEAFQRLGPARQAISTIDQAIAAIDKGASTGIIASRLPNVTQASRELELLRNQMGLAVIGATTFGALSEGELKLALDTGGIDTGMPDLKGYLQRKKVAQTKLANELERAARYLTKPGNTINGWIEENITVSERRGAGLPSQMPTPDQIRAERERRRQAGGR